MPETVALLHCRCTTQTPITPRSGWWSALVPLSRCHTLLSALPSFNAVLKATSACIVGLVQHDSQVIHVRAMQIAAAEKLLEPYQLAAGTGVAPVFF